MTMSLLYARESDRAVEVRGEGARREQPARCEQEGGRVEPSRKGDQDRLAGREGGFVAEEPAEAVEKEVGGHGAGRRDGGGDGT